jgi:hypothetical protein
LESTTVWNCSCVTSVTPIQNCSLMSTVRADFSSSLAATSLSDAPIRKRPAAIGLRGIPIELITTPAAAVGSPHFGQAFALGESIDPQ